MTRFLNIFCGVADNMCNAEVIPIYFSIDGRTLRFCIMAGLIFSLYLIICIDSHNRG